MPSIMRNKRWLEKILQINRGSIPTTGDLGFLVNQRATIKFCISVMSLTSTRYTVHLVSRCLKSFAYLRHIMKTTCTNWWHWMWWSTLWRAYRQPNIHLLSLRLLICLGIFWAMTFNKRQANSSWTQEGSLKLCHTWTQQMKTLGSKVCLLWKC